MQPKQNEVDIILHDLHVHQAELELQNQELRESQQALEASRARYADLFDLAPIGYVTLDSSISVVEINLAGAALLGCRRDEVLGKPFRVVGRTHPPGAMSDHVRECLASNRGVRTDLSFHRKSDDAELASTCRVCRSGGPTAPPTAAGPRSSTSPIEGEPNARWRRPRSGSARRASRGRPPSKRAT